MERNAKKTFHDVWLWYLAINLYIAITLTLSLTDHSKRYANDDLSFRVLDISKEIGPSDFEHREFSKIFSIWVMHWVLDHKTALANMYKVLRPGGEVLFFFSSWTPFNDIYDELSKTERWGEYYKQVRRPVRTRTVHASINRVESFVRTPVHALINRVESFCTRFILVLISCYASSNRFIPDAHHANPNYELK